MDLNSILGLFRSNIITINQNINFAFSQDANNNYICTPQVQKLINESSFLKLFISWESFLENSFLNYLLGEPSISGVYLVKYVNPIDLDHANKILIGTQKYVDWGNPDIVRRISALYFENGKPYYDIIGSISSDLFDLRTIRNAAAHLSSTTSNQLDALASRKLNRSVSSYSVSDLLFSIDPSGNGQSTILDTYIALIDLAADQIADYI